MFCIAERVACELENGGLDLHIWNVWSYTIINIFFYQSMSEIGK